MTCFASPPPARHYTAFRTYCVRAIISDIKRLLSAKPCGLNSEQVRHHINTNTGAWHPFTQPRPVVLAALRAYTDSLDPMRVYPCLH